MVPCLLVEKHLADRHLVDSVQRDLVTKQNDVVLDVLDQMAFDQMVFDQKMRRRKHFLCNKFFMSLNYEYS